MGLDMYLEGEYFIWDLGKGEQKAVNLRAAINGVIGDTPGKVKKLVTEAAYWRKANAIHKWFVENVQDDVDDYQRSMVSREQLTSLRDKCLKVSAVPGDAEKILPTQSGFFFGDTEYGECYFEDIKSTIEQLDVILDEEKYPPGEWDFYYRASW